MLGGVNARLLEGHAIEVICAESGEGNHSSSDGEKPYSRPATHCQSRSFANTAPRSFANTAPRDQKIGIDPAKVGQVIGSTGRTVKLMQTAVGYEEIPDIRVSCCTSNVSCCTSKNSTLDLASAQICGLHCIPLPHTCCCPKRVWQLCLVLTVKSISKRRKMLHILKLA